MKPGKGAAFVRSKLKNYVTGNTTERTFRAGESVATADIERIDTQFTYAEGDTVRALVPLFPVLRTVKPAMQARSSAPQGLDR